MHSMAGIITIGVGRCGSTLSSKFNEILVSEHGMRCFTQSVRVDAHLTFILNLKTGLDREEADTGSLGSELANVGVYYNLKSDGKYIQRSVQVEIGPGDDDIYRPSLKTPEYKSDGGLKHMEGCHKNWGNGRYETGPEVIEMVMDLVRKEAESCDALQGFQLAHSIGGGTGAGLGSLIMSRLREDYSERIISTFSVVPSPKVSEFPVDLTVQLLRHITSSQTSTTAIYLTTKACMRTC